MEPHQVSERLLELKSLKSSLALEKNTLELRLSGLNGRVRERHRLPAHEYRNICHEQNEIREKLSAVMQKLNPISNEMREIGEQLNVKNLQFKREQLLGEKVSPKPIIEALIVLRKEYEDFSKDVTRSPTMRTMAAKFLTQLNPIIRKAVSASVESADREI